MKKAESTAERGEALERRKEGFGRLLDICLFQYRINEAFAVNGFSLVILEEYLFVVIVTANETCIINLLEKRRDKLINMPN